MHYDGSLVIAFLKMLLCKDTKAKLAIETGYKCSALQIYSFLKSCVNVWGLFLLVCYNCWDTVVSVILHVEISNPPVFDNTYTHEK